MAPAIQPVPDELLANCATSLRRTSDIAKDRRPRLVKALSWHPRAGRMVVDSAEGVPGTTKPMTRTVKSDSKDGQEVDLKPRRKVQRTVSAAGPRQRSKSSSRRGCSRTTDATATRSRPRRTSSVEKRTRPSSTKKQGRSPGRTRRANSSTGRRSAPSSRSPKRSSRTSQKEGRVSTPSSSTGQRVKRTPSQKSKARLAITKDSGKSRRSSRSPVKKLTRSRSSDGGARRSSSRKSLDRLTNTERAASGGNAKRRDTQQDPELQTLPPTSLQRATSEGTEKRRSDGRKRVPVARSKSSRMSMKDFGALPPPGGLQRAVSAGTRRHPGQSQGCNAGKTVNERLSGRGLQRAASVRITRAISIAEEEDDNGLWLSSDHRGGSTQIRRQRRPRHHRPSMDTERLNAQLQRMSQANERRMAVLSYQLALDDPVDSPSEQPVVKAKPKRSSSGTNILQALSAEATRLFGGQAKATNAKPEISDKDDRQQPCPSAA